ncbi:unnamed protein product [Prunus armeniaca]
MNGDEFNWFTSLRRASSKSPLIFKFRHLLPAWPAVYFDVLHDSGTVGLPLRCLYGAYLLDCPACAACWWTELARQPP